MNRSELQFVEAVETEFKFLVEVFGFRLSRVEPPTFVRYESNMMFLNVYHGRRSYELNVEVGCIAEPTGRSYRIADVLGVLASWDDPRLVNFVASDQQGVRRCVHAIADLVAKFYGPALAGDRTTLDQIAAHTSDRAYATTKEIVERPVREAAEEAWRVKNYARAKELYESIRDSLTYVERKRLDYADKHRDD